VVDGDFAMHEDELQAVLKAMRVGGINIVSIHQHMTHETPCSLRQGADFVCDAHGLRLVKPLETGIDLGEMLVHRVDTFHTFSKAPDGALLAFVSTKEHATVGGVPLAGPEGSAGTVRWQSVSARNQCRCAWCASGTCGCACRSGSCR